MQKVLTLATPVGKKDRTFKGGGQMLKINLRPVAKPAEVGKTVVTEDLELKTQTKILPNKLATYVGKKDIGFVEAVVKMPKCRNQSLKQNLISKAYKINKNNILRTRNK